jgi:hypothetical protein
MPAKEQEPAVSNEKHRGLLDRISRSKRVRLGAAGLALAGIGVGAIKGIEASSHKPSAIEYAHDTSGYKAELSKDNLNNPNTIFRIVRNLSPGEKPYVLVHTPGMKKGEEVKVDIQSQQDLEVQGDLTDLGVAAREVLIRDQEALLFGRESTPALQADHSGFQLEAARDSLRNNLYTGPVSSAPEQLKDAGQDQRTATIEGADGGYVKVVEPATPSLER